MRMQRSGAEDATATGYHRALVIVGSMGSFEPMDFWKLLNLTYYHSQKKELRVQNS